MTTSMHHHQHGYPPLRASQHHGQQRGAPPAAPKSCSATSCLGGTASSVAVPAPALAPKSCIATSCLGGTTSSEAAPAPAPPECTARQSAHRLPQPARGLNGLKQQHSRLGMHCGQDSAQKSDSEKSPVAEGAMKRQRPVSGDQTDSDGGMAAAASTVRTVPCSASDGTCTLTSWSLPGAATCSIAPGGASGGTTTEKVI